MKKLHVYVDTSVLGGCFEPEFASWSKGLVDDFRVGIFIPILSALLETEVRRAPESVRTVYNELLTLAGESVPISDEALDLLAAYETHGVLSPKFRSDMLHIALATVADVDVLVSWNFKHIVRFDKIRLFNAVNLEQGYKPLSIRSPREVTTYGRDPDPSR
jgi:predicted nucleic acid-binding protein